MKKRVLLSAAALMSMTLLCGTAYAQGMGPMMDGFVTLAGPGEEGGYVSSGPGAQGMAGGSGTGTPAAKSAGTSVTLSGTYVTPSYWRGDVYCAESCVSDGNGGWIYNKTDAYDPTQDYLYKVIREDGDWYVCENFGGEIWLKKSDCTALQSLNISTQNDTRLKLISAALEKLGKPYAYGSSGPDSFDCSGFVNYCYSTVGISVPRTSSEIGAMANISADQLQPGDILWSPGHVSIYLGDGTIIHSEKTGTGVIAERLQEGALAGYQCISLIG